MSDTREPARAEKKRRTWRYRAARLGVVLLVIYGIWLAAASVLQERILFPGATAWNAITRPSTTPGVAWERWSLGRDDGTRGLAWFRAARTAGAPAPAVVFFHGNGDIAPNRTDIGDLYAPIGVHTLLVEYPGYHDSQGTPSEAGIIADALAAIDRLLERDDVDPARIVYHGHSIGGGAAAQVAERRPPVALILESTFTSMGDMVRRYAVPVSILRHRFDTAAVLRTLDAPVLIMHGDLDVIVYPDHAEDNARTAKDATHVRFPTRGHDGCYLAPNYASVIEDFLEVCGVLPG